MAKSRRKWTGHVAQMAYRWESQKERDHRCVDNIKIDLEKIGWSAVDWIHMAQVRDQWRALVSTVMNLHMLGNSRGAALKKGSVTRSCASGV
jgi:hypothetical protein